MWRESCRVEPSERFPTGLKGWSGLPALTPAEGRAEASTFSQVPPRSEACIDSRPGTRGRQAAESTEGTSRDKRAGVSAEWTFPGWKIGVEKVCPSSHSGHVHPL